MIQTVVDPSSNRASQIDNAVAAIGRSTQKLALFREVYRGQKQIKTTEKLCEFLGLDARRILTIGKELSDAGLFKSVKREGRVAYQKFGHITHLRDSIIKKCEEPFQLQKETVSKDGGQHIYEYRRTRGPITRSTKRIELTFFHVNPVTDLRTDREARLVNEAIKQLPKREKVQLSTHLATTVDQFSNALFDLNPDIIHLASHGDENGFVFDQAEDGEYVNFDQLSRIILSSNCNPKLIMLSSCEGGGNCARLLNCCNAVMAAKLPMVDDDALVFAPKFYSALFRGASIEGAVDNARVFLELRGVDLMDHLVLEARNESDKKRTFISR